MLVTRLIQRDSGRWHAQKRRGDKKRKEKKKKKWWVALQDNEDNCCGNRHDDKGHAATLLRHTANALVTHSKRSRRQGQRKSN